MNCPNCGSEKPPEKKTACAEKIEFSNCVDCDFSTWDEWEFEETPREKYPKLYFQGKNK